MTTYNWMSMSFGTWFVFLLTINVAIIKEEYYCVWIAWLTFVTLMPIGNMIRERIDHWRKIDALRNLTKEAI